MFKLMSHKSCEDYKTHQHVKNMLVLTKQTTLPSFVIYYMLIHTCESTFVLLKCITFKQIKTPKIICIRKTRVAAWGHFTRLV